MNMDGWNKYLGENYGNLFGLVPPQQSIGYMNESNYGYNCQMSQASSECYNNGSYEEWQSAYNGNMFQPQQAYTYSIPSSNNQVPPVTSLSKNNALMELFRRYSNGSDTSQSFQTCLPSYGTQDLQSMSTSYPTVQQEWMMPSSQVEDMFYMQGSNFQNQENYLQEQSWQPPSEEIKPSVEDRVGQLMEMMYEMIEERREERKKKDEENERRFEALERQMSQMISERNTLQEIENFDEKFEEEFEVEECSGNEDSSDEELFEDKEDKENSSEDEESKEVYEFNEEEQGLKALEEEFESEMSISKPFNSSSCIEFQNVVYIDFVLPIDSSQCLREKRKLEEMLGAYVVRRNKWWSQKERSMECKFKQVEFLKPISKDVTEVVTCHKCLIEEEAQRLKFDGKNERYPWPFR